jgi:hypothetical protein
LLAGQIKVKEAVNKENHSVKGLDPQEEDQVMHQLEQLTEAIQ